MTENVKLATDLVAVADLDLDLLSDPRVHAECLSCSTYGWGGTPVGHIYTAICGARTLRRADFGVNVVPPGACEGCMTGSCERCTRDGGES